MPIRIIPMQTPGAPTPPALPPRISIQTGGPNEAVIVNTDQQLSALQAQASALVRQLAGLRVQRNFLDRQARDDGLNDAARGQIDANRANLDVQIAQGQADLDNVRAQIAAQHGVPLGRVTQGGQVIVPQGRQAPNVDPEMVIGMSFALLMVIALPMSIAFARRVWRGRPQPVAPKMDEIAPRLDRLEHAVDAIAIEVERISEGQRFVTKILSERPRSTAPAPTRADSMDGGIPDARQILALGAGPAEPIRMAERQTVRQVNTPH
jgi:hypothetical protein